jgi:hypothetical protein
VDPFVVGVLVPVALLAVAGVVRAARESTISHYDPEERADFNDATRRFM